LGQTVLALYNTGIIMVNLTETDHLEGLGVDGEYTKMKLVETGWAAWTEFVWFRTVGKTGFCKNFNDPLGQGPI